MVRSVWLVRAMMLCVKSANELPSRGSGRNSPTPPAQPRVRYRVESEPPVGATPRPGVMFPPDTRLSRPAGARAVLRARDERGVAIDALVGEERADQPVQTAGFAGQSDFLGKVLELRLVDIRIFAERKRDRPGCSRCRCRPPMSTAGTR